VPNQAREADVRCAASMSAGVGGSNACLVFEAVPPLRHAERAGGEAP
jgi:3-oxoacyl-(acyl-carrier-protein) synthase